MKAHPKTGRTIREEAEFLARDIFSDVLAPEKEISFAIEQAIRRYAAPRYTRNGNVKPKAPPNDQSKPFIEWFASVYALNRAGAIYLPRWPRDMALVKRLLGAVSVDELQDCARILLDARTADRFIEESDRGIPVLSMRFNWLNGRRVAFLAKQKVSA